MDHAKTKGRTFRIQVAKGVLLPGAPHGPALLREVARATTIGQPAGGSDRCQVLLML